MSEESGDKLTFWMSAKIGLPNYSSVDIGASQARTMDPVAAEDPAKREALWRELIEEVSGIVRVEAKKIKEKAKK